MNKTKRAVFSTVFFRLFDNQDGRRRKISAVAAAAATAAGESSCPEKTAEKAGMSGFLLGLTAVAMSSALSSRERETSRTDALTASQAALNVMSREISNAGYGLTNNGIVLADSDKQKLHFRANTKNDNLTTDDIDEDITYYYDPSSLSVVRYDANATPSTTAVINQVSEVNFLYYDFTDSNSTPTMSYAPTANTGRVKITLIVYLPEVQGQPKKQTVTLTTEVTLRNSTYMLNQY